MMRNIISLIPEKSPGNPAQRTRKLKAKIKGRKRFLVALGVKKER